MGSFSWERADYYTKRKNIAEGDPFKLLVPEEFGGGSFKDYYTGYGRMEVQGVTIDLYGVLAYWNKCEGMVWDEELDHYPCTMEEIIMYGNTNEQDNRCKGIEIGCYDEDIDKLKYPLKLVSASYPYTYEQCEGKSYGDPEQGWARTYWTDEEMRQAHLRSILG